MSPSSSSGSGDGHVDALDFDRNRKPAAPDFGSASGESTPHGLLRDDESLLSNVVDGIMAEDRGRMGRQLRRYLSYASGILSA